MVEGFKINRSKIFLSITLVYTLFWRRANDDFWMKYFDNIEHNFSVISTPKGDKIYQNFNEVRQKH